MSGSDRWTKQWFHLICAMLPLLISLSLNACSPSTQMNTHEKLDAYRFPTGFHWGTATAAYQVEGGIRNDWSIAGMDAGKACQHYEKYDQDFAEAKKMGTNTQRFSIEWSRIEPQKGQWDRHEVEHYRKVLKSLKQHGLTPMVTLHHFTNPVWIAEQKGWENPETVHDFIRYVHFIVNEFKDDVTLWITLNEPLVYAFKSYDSGEWPPHKKDRQAALQVIKNMITAHGQAYKTIHELDKTAQVGFAKHITPLKPNFFLNPLDHIVASYQNRIFNQAFWDAIIKGEIELNIPGQPIVKLPYDNHLKGSMDFIGVNYYTRWFVTASGKQVTKKGASLSDIGWEIYPNGLLDVLKTANIYAKQLKIPIYITENGIDDRSDDKRAAFIISHLMNVWIAIQQGIPIKGYMHWSLIDNFEWADGYAPKFGLLGMDRTWRNSASVYQQIVTTNTISSAQVNQYLRGQP